MDYLYIHKKWGHLSTFFATSGYRYLEVGNISVKTKYFSKIFWGIAQGPRYYSIMQKTRHQKSHASVPLTLQQFVLPIFFPSLHSSVFLSSCLYTCFSILPFVSLIPGLYMSYLSLIPGLYVLSFSYPRSVCLIFLLSPRSVCLIFLLSPVCMSDPWSFTCLSLFFCLSAFFHVGLFACLSFQRSVCVPFCHFFPFTCNLCFYLSVCLFIWVSAF